MSNLAIETKFTIAAMILAIIAGFAWALGGKVADKVAPKLKL